MERRYEARYDPRGRRERRRSSGSESDDSDSERGRRYRSRKRSRSRSYRSRSRERSRSRGPPRSRGEGLSGHSAAHLTSPSVGAGSVIHVGLPPRKWSPIIVISPVDTTVRNAHVVSIFQTLGLTVASCKRATGSVGGADHSGMASVEVTFHSADDAARAAWYMNLGSVNGQVVSVRQLPEPLVPPPSQ